MVKLKPATTLKQLERLANKNSVEMMGAHKEGYMKEWYYLACTNQSKGNSLIMANLLYESGLFEEAMPNFILTTINRR